MTADCPGSKNFKHPQPGIIECPSCARGLEVWTDEFSVTCPNCKNIILHQQDIIRKRKARRLQEIFSTGSGLRKRKLMKYVK